MSYLKIRIIMATRQDINRKLLDCIKSNKSITKTLIDIRRCLEQQADVNTTDDGCTPLHLAVLLNKKPKILKLLLKRGADVNMTRTYGYTPLHDAVWGSDETVVNLLLRHGADLNMKSSEGGAPLHIAARHGRKSVIELLLSHKADINLQARCRGLYDLSYYYENTPLQHVTSEDPPDLELSERIKIHTKKQYAQTRDDSTPLMMAVLSESLPVVQFLLENGADVNVQGSLHGLSALHVAIAQARSAPIVELLLDYEADIHALTAEGENPLHMAYMSGPSPVMVDLLINRGADVNVRDSRNYTLLHNIALEYQQDTFIDNTSTLELLLRKKADINARMLKVQNGLGDSTPLHAAVRSKYMYMVDFLLRNGAYKDAQDETGFTPLHCAVRVGDSALVALLLTHGANNTIRNNKGDTPLDLALLSFSEHNSRLLTLLLAAYDRSTNHKALCCDTNKNKLQVGSTDTMGLTGQLYETKLVSLVLIQLLNHKVIDRNSFFLGTNISDIGAIDDLCLRYRLKESSEREKDVVLFMQAKHKDNPMQQKLKNRHLWEASGEFSLPKYFNSYLDIKERFQNGGDPLFETVSSQVDLYFVLYTSALPTLDKKYTEAIPEETLHDLIVTEANVKPFRYDYDDSDIDSLLKMAEQNDTTVEGNADNPVSRKYDERNAKDFFNRLYFYTGQAKEDEVERIVKHEISKHYNDENEAMHFKFKAHTDSIFLRSHNDIREWCGWKGETPYLTRFNDFFSRAKRAYLEEVWMTVFDAINCLKICVDVDIGRYAGLDSRYNSRTTDAFNRILWRLFEMVDTDNIMITVDDHLTRQFHSMLTDNNNSQNVCVFNNNKDVISHDRGETSLLTFTRRLGSSEASGLLLRTKLMGLVFLRMLHHERAERDPRLLLGAKISVGVMGDICLRYKVKGRQRPIALFLHLKHVEDTEKGQLTDKSVWDESGQTSLQKHFASFVQIKERFENDRKEPMFEGNIRDVDCYFALYSTASETISKKNTSLDIDGVVSDVVNTRHDAKPFRYEFEQSDVDRLSDLVVADEIASLRKKILEYRIKLEKVKIRLLERYRIVLAQGVLRPCDQQPEIEKYRLWRFRDEFFTEQEEGSVAFREMFFRNFDEIKREQMKSVKIKLPLTFGNSDMNLCENKIGVKTLVEKLVRLLNRGTDVIVITDDDVRSNRTVKEDIVDIISSAVGNLLIYDKTSNMLKFNLNIEALPPNAASVLREFKEDRHKPFNEDLSKYRMKFHIDGFPKISFEDADYDKIQATYFLNRFWFFCNQAKEDEVERMSREEIQRKYSNMFVSDYVLSHYQNAIQKKWIQIKEPYLNRASELLENAELAYFDNLLLAVINYMYLLNIPTLGIKIKRINKDKRSRSYKRVRLYIQRIVYKLFNLFNSDFNRTIHFSQRYLIQGDMSKLDLVIHPRMEWVALIMTKTNELGDFFYRFEAKTYPKTDTNNTSMCYEFINYDFFNGSCGYTLYRECFDQDRDTGWDVYEQTHKPELLESAYTGY